MAPGFVYVGESIRQDGSRKVYTGMTTRTPRERWSEHRRSVNSKTSTSWVGRGISFRPLGAVWSWNAHKAERTIKRMSAVGKRQFGRHAARRYYSRRR
jgi:predicted GIY-YIG superfamily endonuclease